MIYYLLTCCHFLYITLSQIPTYSINKIYNLLCNLFTDANNDQIAFTRRTVKTVLSPKTPLGDTRAPRVIARKMERDERANTNAAVRACNSVWQGISAIYPGIDNTRQRVAGCAIQRNVHAQTRTYTRARVYSHRKKERRRLHTQHTRAPRIVGPKGTRINVATMTDPSTLLLCVGLINLFSLQSM